MSRARAASVHYSPVDPAQIGRSAIKTPCGRIGWLAPNSKTEFDTAKGDRFEAANNRRQVTCKRCRALSPRQGGGE